MKKSCFNGVGNCLKLLLKKGVDEGVFSGAAVGVYKKSKKGEEKLVVCYGKTKKESPARVINNNTLFDLASLTKPLCTVLSILHLIETNKISLDTQIKGLVGTKTPFISNNIQIANLLSHSSGFEAYKPFYEDFKPVLDIKNKKKLVKKICKEKLVYETGKKCIYSDLGYILLGEIVERISEEPLNSFFESRITGPLGLEKQIMFRQVDTYAKRENKTIAATQCCPWRKRLLQGEVDDEHCWLMNGVAGHAGLFGSIEGVLSLTSHILNQWQGRKEHPSYSIKLLQRTLTRQYNNETWCLGFDTPSRKHSSGGSYLSKNSVGHLGFTGTSFWIDPEKDMVIVLLTNRIHPTRNNEQIKEFRPLLHNLVFEDMDSQ